METSSAQPDHSHDASRRRLIKATTAAAVGVVAWSEPTIKGLARRPAYAAPGSTNPTIVMLAPGTYLLPPAPVDGVIFTLSQAGTDYRISATAVGCNCAFVDYFTGDVTLEAGFEVVPGALLNPSTLVFAWGDRFVPPADVVVNNKVTLSCTLS